MALLITRKKTQWAMKVIAEIAPKLDEGTFMEVVLELAETYQGIEPSSKDEDLQIDITDVQAVALAAALSSVWEIKKNAR